MKKSVALTLLLALVGFMVVGCNNVTPAFAGLSATIPQIERDNSGRAQATVRFSNPNLAAYNVSKVVLRVYFDATEVGRIELDKPFGIPPQQAVMQTGELIVQNQAAFDAAVARGSASYRTDTTTSFQLYGDKKEVIKSTASGTVTLK